MDDFMNRRNFLITSGVGALGLATFASCNKNQPPTVPAQTESTTPTQPKEALAMTISLPALPYAFSALEPHLSAENLELHHSKHHNAYVTNLNKLIADGKADGQQSLEELIMAAPAGAVFNNAAQIWNHTFYWHCMTPTPGTQPSAELAAAIERDIASMATLREKFIDISVSQFGSGWGWLVAQDDRLALQQTGNADLPMKHGATALLTCDVWEHAYYPSYKNARAAYVEVFFDKLINWDFVSRNFAQR